MFVVGQTAFGVSFIIIHVKNVSFELGVRFETGPRLLYHSDSSPAKRSNLARFLKTKQRLFFVVLAR